MPNAYKMVVEGNDEDNDRKDYGYKICYKLKLDNEKCYSNMTPISKILKVDENNQCSFAMTKPLPISCIKKDQMSTWRKFSLLPFR